MTREEAISHIIGLEHAIAWEFYCSQQETDAGLAETHSALRALGVTDDELVS